MKTSMQKHMLFDAVVWTAALMFIVLLGVHEAHAGERRFEPGPPVYRDECGSCHVPYPRALLQPTQWDAHLRQLGRHFGVDASVDAAAERQIRAYLGAAAPQPAAAASPATPLPRISTQPWFVREHRKATSAAAAGAVKSMSDCAACHTQAAQGDFSETTLRRAR